MGQSKYRFETWNLFGWTQPGGGRITATMQPWIKNSLKVLPLALVLPVMIGAASVSPHDAASNLSNWARVIGINNVPAWLSKGQADGNVLIASIVLSVAYIAVAWGLPWVFRRVAKRKPDAFRGRKMGPVLLAAIGFIFIGVAYQWFRHEIKLSPASPNLGVASQHAIEPQPSIEVFFTDQRFRTLRFQNNALVSSDQEIAALKDQGPANVFVGLEAKARQFDVIIRNASEVILKKAAIRITCNVPIKNMTPGAIQSYAMGMALNKEEIIPYLKIKDQTIMSFSFPIFGDHNEINCSVSIIGEHFPSTEYSALINFNRYEGQLPDFGMRVTAIDLFDPKAPGPEPKTGIHIRATFTNRGLPGIVTEWLARVTPRGKEPDVSTQFILIPPDLKFRSGKQWVTIKSEDSLAVKAGSAPVGTADITGDLLFYVDLKKSDLMDPNTMIDVRVFDTFNRLIPVGLLRLGDFPNTSASTGLPVQSPPAQSPPLPPAGK